MLSIPSHQSGPYRGPIVSPEWNATPIPQELLLPILRMAHNHDMAYDYEIGCCPVMVNVRLHNSRATSCLATYHRMHIRIGVGASPEETAEGFCASAINGMIRARRLPCDPPVRLNSAERRVAAPLAAWLRNNPLVYRGRPARIVYLRVYDGKISTHAREKRRGMPNYPGGLSDVWAPYPRLIYP